MSASSIARSDEALLVTIDGVDASGKTTLAQRLVEGLRKAEYRALHFQFDWYRRALSWRGPKTEADQYYEDYFDYRGAREALSGLLRRGRLLVPVFSSVTDEVEEHRSVGGEGTELVVAEGVFTARLTDAMDAFRIFIDLPLQRARLRLHERDLASKGRPSLEIERRIVERYFPAHLRYLEEYRPAQSADVLLGFSDQERMLLRGVFARLERDGLGESLERLILKAVSQDDRAAGGVAQGDIVNPRLSN